MFGSGSAIKRPEPAERLKSLYPAAHIIGCSTSGQILGARVFSDSITATAVQFERTHISLAQVRINEVHDSHEAGGALASAFEHEKLAHVLVFSDGLRVNGSELVRCMWETLPYGVAVTGGLASDGLRFNDNVVCLDGEAEEGKIIAVGLYGENIKTAFSSRCGWYPFGIDRVVTRSSGNELLELDGKPAYDLYAEYLGELADEMPATASLLPLNLRIETEGLDLVRAAVAVNKDRRSLTFAGGMPEGATARLMRGSAERILKGAADAARGLQKSAGGKPAELALIVSGTGRKVALGQRVEEEVEAARDELGDKTALAGFYSYGEISPVSPHAPYEMKNNTITITTFLES